MFINQILVHHGRVSKVKEVCSVIRAIVHRPPPAPMVIKVSSSEHSHAAVLSAGCFQKSKARFLPRWPASHFIFLIFHFIVIFVLVIGPNQGPAHKEHTLRH